MMKGDIFYVGIEEPDNFRRALLETSKQMIQLLQRYEKLKTIRAEKYAQAAKLKVIYDDIISLMGMIKSEFPSVDIKSLPKYEESAIIRLKEEQPASKQQPEAKQPVRKQVTNVEKLESELGDIESKLKMLR